MRLDRAAMISRLVLVIWRNVAWEALGRSRELAILAGAGAVFCLLAIEFMILEVAGPLATGIHSNLGAQGQVDLARLTFDEIALAAALVTTLLSGLAPNLSVLDRNLAAMPVRPSERYVGYLMPSLALALVALVALFAPVAGVMSTAAPGPGWIVPAFAVQVVAAVLLTCLLQLAVTVALIRLFGLSEVLARMIGAAGVGLLYLALMLADVAATMHTLQSPLSPLNVLSLAADPGVQPVDRLLVIAAAVLAALLLATWILMLATLLVRSEGVGLRPLFPSFLDGGRGLPQVVVTATRLATRHPENRVTFALYFAIAVIIAWYLASQRIAGEWGGFAVLLGAAAAASLGLNAYGRTRALRWIAVIAPLRRGEWLAANAAGAVLVSAAVGALLVAPFLAAGTGGSISVLASAALGIFALTFAWMHAIGVVVPYSEDVPLSSALVSLAALVLGLPLFYLLTKLGLADVSWRSLLLVVAVIAASALTVSTVDAVRLKATGP